MQRAVPSSGTRRARALLFLAIVILAGKSSGAPAWNFDVVGYVASALALSHPDRGATQLHTDTYRVLAAVAPADAYSAIVTSSDYRRALHTNAEFLSTQIPFYQCKLGYVALVALLGQLGMNLARATYFISAVSYVALGALAFIWFSRYVPSVMAFCLCLLFVLAPPVRRLAGYSTPDLLSAFLMALASLVAIELRGFRSSVAISLLACAVRPDNLVFASVLLGWFAFHGVASPGRTQIAVALGVLVATCWFVNAATHAYDWGVLAKHTFVERLYEPARMNERIVPRQYFEAFVRGLRTRQLTSLLVLGALSLGALYLAKRVPAAPSNSAARRILVVAWVGIVAHYVGFPLLDSRFFVYSYLLIAVAATALIVAAKGKVPGTSEPALR